MKPFYKYVSLGIVSYCIGIFVYWFFPEVIGLRAVYVSMFWPWIWTIIRYVINRDLIFNNGGGKK